MQQFIQILPSVTSIVWQASWQAVCLAILVWGLVRVLGTRIAARWRFVLWSLVFVRLALPLLPSSPTSGFRLIQSQPIETAVLEVMPDADVLPPSPQSLAIVEVSPQFEEAEPPAQFDRVPVDDAVSTSVANLPVSPPATMPWNWPLIAAVGWLLGFLVLGTRRAVQQALLAGRSRNWRSTNDARVESLMGKSCRRLGLRSTIRVLVSDDETGPAVTGVWWPRIVLPRSVLRDFSDEQLELILLHELAHVRRRDLWIQEALLLLRAIHWFNPCAWWVFQRLQVEREMACDELVLDMTGADSRQSYGMTLLQVVRQTNVRIPSPGLLGTSDTSSRLQRRLVMIRDYRPRSWKTSLLAMATILVAVAVGLTNPPVGNTTEEPTSAVASDVKNTPVEKTTPAEKTVPAAPEVAADKTFEIKGRCLDDAGQPVADAEVSVIYIDRYGSPPKDRWRRQSGANGEYHFEHLKRLSSSSESTELYFVIAGKEKFASASKRIFAKEKETEFDLTLDRKPGVLSGRVTTEKGEPVRGVEVYQGHAGNPIRGFAHAVTDKDGHYTITDLKRWNAKDTETFDPKTGIGEVVSGCYFYLKHPDYPVTRGTYTGIPQEVDVVLKPGITIEGLVHLKGQPAAGVEITAQGIRKYDFARVLTNQAGIYRLVLTDDQYNIRAQAKDRTCVALDSFDGPIGKVTKAPDLELIEGGFIVGKVVDMQTGKPVSKLPDGHPLRVAHHGPAYPISGAAVGAAAVADDGTYRLRVAPGENYPYLMHDIKIKSERTPSNATSVKPIVVREGETVTFDFHIGAEAEKSIAGAESAFRSRRMTPRIVIPKVGANRSAVQRPETPVGKLLNQLDELRSNSGSDEWAMVLRDLIQLGPAAVPELIAEMDRTENEYMLRCLAFAMRGIGDKRAIPAMIRALPKTCVTSRSDMGYSAKDPELLAFMQQHDMSERDEKTRYSFGRAVNEIQYTLRKLTGSSHGEIEIAGVFLSGTPRQQFLQRSLYQRCAERWAAWWEQHWKEHVEDDRYAKVNLAPLVAESPGEQGFPHGPRFKIEGRHSNHLLESVRNPQAQRVFHDLDTGRVASLPAHLKVADGQPERLDDILAWAAREGFDLMGTEYSPPKSDKPHYVLRGLGLTAWQIETNRWEDLDTELQQNQPLEMGTRTDGLLAHFDIAKGQYVPEETATFLFQTREGGFGAMFVGVEVHDDTLKPGGVSTGDDELSPIAFHKGRRFAYKMFAEVTAGGKDPFR